MGIIGEREVVDLLYEQCAMSYRPSLSLSIGIQPFPLTRHG